MNTLRVTQIKVGDILTGTKFGEALDPVEVKVKTPYTFTVYYPRWNSERVFTRKQLSAAGYSIVTRNGVVIGQFLVRYW